MSQRLKLGEIVLRAGVIDEMQLEAALGEQEKWGGRLGLILVRQGYATEQDLVQALAGQLGVPVATLDGKKISKRVLDLVPYDYADDHTCLPLVLKNEEGVDTLYVGMDDPSNLEVLDDLAFRTGMRIKPVVVATSEICEGIDRFYRNIDPGARPFQKEASLAAAVPEPATVTSRDTNPFEGDEAPYDTDRASTPQPIGIENETPQAGGEPSTRLILHALAQIMIEKGIMTREEFQQQIGLLTACDEGDPIQD
ncbi:MAG: hypothetical protein GY733_12740 [bacterium]|nr:hypothetical protein [bacterium]